MDVIHTLSMALGSAWGAGINLYATILVLGVMNATGAVDLPPTLDILSHPAVIFIAAIMFIIEFVVDKIPGVDSGWDAIHSFIRIPAGAVLAAQAFGPVDPGWQLAAALVGGSIAAGTHATKAGTRLLINTSPEPFTNWTASITEDVLVIAGVWAALNHPWIFAVFFLFFLAFTVWALPRLYRVIRRGMLWIKSRLSPTPVAAGVPATGHYYDDDGRSDLP